LDAIPLRESNNNQVYHHCFIEYERLPKFQIKNLTDHLRYQPTPLSSPAADRPWLEHRFTLRLKQDPAGDWYILSPSGTLIPASIFEVSLWLDLQQLKCQSLPQKFSDGPMA
jgi:hypothetical protein